MTPRNTAGNMHGTSRARPRSGLPSPHPAPKGAPDQRTGVSPAGTPADALEKGQEAAKYAATGIASAFLYGRPGSRRRMFENGIGDAPGKFRWLEPVRSSKASGSPARPSSQTAVTDPCGCEHCAVSPRHRRGDKIGKTTGPVFGNVGRGGSATKHSGAPAAVPNPKTGRRRPS